MLEWQFHLHCCECGEELKPGDKAVAATIGVIGDDGGFYMNNMEPWLWVRHFDCPKRQSGESRQEKRRRNADA